MSDSHFRPPEVSEETNVCVIEAMKVFNNVKADCKGTIAKIMVNNGQVVEFGQPFPCQAVSDAAGYISPTRMRSRRRWAGFARVTLKRATRPRRRFAGI